MKHTTEDSKISRLRRALGLSLPNFVFVFVLSIVGFSLFFAQPASAYDVTKDYTVYEKSGNYLYYNGRYSTFAIINWTPQINITKVYCDSSPAGGQVAFNSKLAYTNCTSLIIKGLPGSPNNAWFEEAQYSFEIGDFDHSETLSIGGGKIAKWGNSTNDPTDSQNIHAKTGANGCDTPSNPDYSDDCSVLILFNPTYPGDFHITISNYDNSNGKTYSDHEYWYGGPKMGSYQTLTLNPNGGSVVDNEVQPKDGTIGDESTIWSHKSGANLLREYSKGSNANEYPTPTRNGYIFKGWYTAASGGELVYKLDPLNNDETLYAHWEKINFKNVPTVDATPESIEEGSTVAIKYTIANSGLTDTTSTSWWIHRQVTGGPKTLVDNGTGLIINKSDSWLRNDTDSKTDGLAVGKQICYYLSVSPISQDNNATTEVSDCVKIVKKPKVQIWGGDLKVGRDFTSSKITTSKIQASTSVKKVDSTLKTFGSWAEYALVAPGFISGAASGSGLNLGLKTTSSTDQCDYSTLSFSNSDSSGACNSAKIGSYNFSKKTIPDISSKFPVNSSKQALPSSFTLDKDTKGLFATAASANVTITGGTIPLGNWVVINAPSANITISGDINYAAGPFNSINEIPQLVIIAKNIYISNAVRNIDSWLIAKEGTINTCAEKQTGKISQNDCNNPLRINGPVMASHLKLRRTAGSGAGPLSGEPAEILNLRADAYLWAYARAAGTGRVWTVYTRNVPPRL